MKIKVFKARPVSGIPVDLGVNDLNSIVLGLLYNFLQNGICVRLKDFLQ